MCFTPRMRQRFTFVAETPSPPFPLGVGGGAPFPTPPLLIPPPPSWAGAQAPAVGRVVRARAGRGREGKESRRGNSALAAAYSSGSSGEQKGGARATAARCCLPLPNLPQPFYSLRTTAFRGQREDAPLACHLVATAGLDSRSCPGDLWNLAVLHRRARAKTFLDKSSATWLNSPNTQVISRRLGR